MTRMYYVLVVTLLALLHPESVSYTHLDVYKRQGPQCVPHLHHLHAVFMPQAGHSDGVSGYDHHFGGSQGFHIPHQMAEIAKLAGKAVLHHMQLLEQAIEEKAPGTRQVFRLQMMEDGFAGKLR